MPSPSTRLHSFRVMPDGRMELQHSFAKNNGVPCVVSTLKSGHPRGLLGEPVNEFSFAFIAPLSA